MNYTQDSKGEDWEQRETLWGRKHQELESKIRQLAIKKQHFFKQKQALKQLQTRKIKEVSVPELRTFLELAQDEIQDLHRNCELERRKSNEISKQLFLLKDRCQLLEQTNRSLTTLLVEKDTLLHNYLVDSQAGKLKSDRYLEIKSTEKTEISFPITNESIGQEGNIYKPHSAIGKKVDTNPMPRVSRNSEEYSSRASSFSIASGSELQTLYRKSTEQIKMLHEMISKKDQDNKKLKQKLEEARQDFNTLSTQLLKENTDVMTKGSGLEIENLRKQNEEYESNLKKIDIRYSRSLEQLESDLASSRKKVLELLDDKSVTENLMFSLKEERKKIEEVINSREVKIQELQVSLKDVQKQLNDLQLKESQEMISTLKEHRANSESKLAALSIENSELREQLENIESEVSFISPSQINESVLKAIQDLSLIILSKEKTNTLDYKTKQLVHQIFGDNFSNIVEAYEKQFKVIYSEKQEMKEILHVEIEKRISVLNSIEDLIDFIFKLAEILLRGDMDELANEFHIRHDELENLTEKTSEALKEASFLIEELSKENLVLDRHVSY